MTPTFRTSRLASAVESDEPHLILVGLPGSGKTTVGQEVAKRTGRSFLDLDQEIERREGRTISELFAEDGEVYFRRKERELTEELTLVGGLIIAPGGGWITQPDVVSIVRPPGRLVYLRVTAETVIRRLGPSRTTRPLLVRPDPLGELKRLLAERKAAYESADFTVSTELYDLQRVIEKVIELASVAR
jgi:shikimate kinase